MNSNNYLSLWIANFGVVPWFSFAFFLLRPAFLTLLFLLVLVFVVLDAITLSLNNINKSVFRSNKLTTLLLFVKVFVMVPHFALAKNTAKLDQDLFLSKGEQIKLKIPDLKSFSLGNKEVITATYKTSSLLIKGRSIGFSDILIFGKKSQKRIKVFVISKREQLNKIRIAQALKEIGLKIKVTGEIMRIEGELNTMFQYQVFTQSIDSIKSQKIINVSLTQGLRNSIIEQVYKESYQLGSSLSSCENFDYYIYCYFKNINTRSSRFKHLKNKYSIKLIDPPEITSSHNYKISYKIFKISDSNQKVRDLGPSSINLSLLSLLNSNKNTFIEGDIIELKDTLSKATVLAKPESVLTLGTESNLKLGGEFPIITTNSIGQSTQWKYYGLKVRSSLKRKLNRLLLNFNTSLSTPFEENISSTQGKSSLFITPGKYTKLFQIGFNQSKVKNESIPLLNKIPILKYLFQRDLDSNSYQKIICYIKLEVEK